ncbi:MAG TPA: TadE/TadG family type IV pilus assembly protein [Caulobacteraceae bacterium]
MTGRQSRLSRLAQRYASDRRGSAAAEFALWAVALVVPIASAMDVGFYAYENMELNNAAQAAAQAAWSLCKTSTMLPAATACSGLQSALTTAAHSTSLGSSAVLQSSSEGYYCMNTAGALQLVGTAGVIPVSGAGTAPTGPVSSCASLGTGFAGNTLPSGDYVQIKVNYAYSPVFRGLTVLGLLPTTVTRTAWMRLQ